MQEQGFPVYAPHWIHVSPPIARQETQRPIPTPTKKRGLAWIAYSRPPTYWDNLPNKDMKTFLDEHVRRFFANDV